jgi:hypothetical protein
VVTTFITQSISRWIFSYLEPTASTFGRHDYLACSRSLLFGDKHFIISKAPAVCVF